MDLAQFAVGTTTPQEVLGKLKATHSTDADVLFAAKTAMAAPFRQQRFTGLLLLIVGAVSSLTLVLAIIGIPVALFGLWVWRRGISNLAIVESAYAQFIEMASAAPAVAAR
jgi:hypothetical protein